MNFTDQLARRAIVILMILNIASLASSYTALVAVHKIQDTLSAQATATVSAAQQTADAARQTATAVKNTAESAKDASLSIVQTARSLCSASHVDCAPPPPYAVPAPATTARSKP